MLLLSIALLLLFNPASCSFNENEQVFLSAPQAESARQNLRFITSLPHVAGTDGDAITADFVQQKFVAAGISNVTQFHLNVLLNYPQSPPHVSLLVSSARNNTRFVQANLSEDVLEMDDTSDVFLAQSHISWLQSQWNREWSAARVCQLRSATRL
jgi:hypothetical protein